MENKMKSQENLASEIIKDIQEEMNIVIQEMDSLDSEFDKLLFIFNAALEAIGNMGVPENIDEGLIQHYNICNVNMQLSIAYDYVVKIQNCVSGIVTRELKKRKESKVGGKEDGLQESEY